MIRVKGISPKLSQAISPPLTAVVTAAILTNTLDRGSLAALAGIVIGAVLGYHAPVGQAKTTPLVPSVFASPVATSSGAGTAVTSSGFQRVTDPDTDGDTMLEPELADKKPTVLAPPDEVDSPEQTQEALS